MHSPAVSHLNLGILAHVDAGKTSLTERLLYEAGVLEAAGSVDAGTTLTDSMDLERRRGITIRAAVTSFPLHDLTVNLVDTPGHPDFIAEVERCLAVLDAAVLVLSAVEGVQPPTVVTWRALRRIGVPTVLFVNKLDRTGADVAGVLEQVRHRLTPAVVQLSRWDRAGSRDVRVTPIDVVEESVVATVAEADDRVLARWVAGSQPRRHDMLRALRHRVQSGALTPLVCGSAITGAGTPVLREVLRELVPRPRPPRAGSDQAAGTVFAVDRDERGRRAWVRMWSGELHVRDRIAIGDAPPARITQVAVSAAGGLEVAPRVGAGQIAALRGTPARIGDAIGQPPPRRTHRFTPGTMEALVEPDDPTQRSSLFTALTELADEDPLIALRLDEVGSEAAVTLHGEVQKEVIGALLEERYGVRAHFAPTSVIHIERVIGIGAASDEIGLRGNPYLAGIGLRVEAAPVGHGVEFSPGIERGNLPPAFIAATEDGVRTALRQGPHGWEVTDCVVTMTASQYWPRQSKPHQKFDKSISSVAADFRHLAPVVVAAALRQAGTRVCRPVDRFDLELPDETYGTVAVVLSQIGARILDISSTDGWTRLTGHVPSAAAAALIVRLPNLTSGAGILLTQLEHHEPVPDEPAPERRRTGPDPLDRTVWFRDMPR